MGRHWIMSQTRSCRGAVLKRHDRRETMKTRLVQLSKILSSHSVSRLVQANLLLFTFQKNRIFESSIIISSIRFLNHISQASFLPLKKQNLLKSQITLVNFKNRHVKHIVCRTTEPLLGKLQPTHIRVTLLFKYRIPPTLVIMMVCLLILVLQNREVKTSLMHTYITHHDKLPLEIDGRSKRRIQPLKKEQFNGETMAINQQQKSLIMRKLSSNTHDLNHLKSVLPSDDPRKKQTKPASIRTFNQNKENIKSGIDYLMQRGQSMKDSTHKEKAHVAEHHPPSSKRPEKKHFLSVNGQSTEPDTIRSNHRKTSQIKLVNDLYSDVYREEKETLQSKRTNNANLFRCSQDLGFQKKAGKKISENKLVEMLGSECMRGEKGPLRERRQDWRTSNINFF